MRGRLGRSSVGCASSPRGPQNSRQRSCISRPRGERSTRHLDSGRCRSFDVMHPASAGHALRWRQPFPPHRLRGSMKRSPRRTAHAVRTRGSHTLSPTEERRSHTESSRFLGSRCSGRPSGASSTRATSHSSAYGGHSHPPQSPEYRATSTLCSGVSHACSRARTWSSTAGLRPTGGVSPASTRSSAATPSLARPGEPKGGHRSAGRGSTSTQASVAKPSDSPTPPGRSVPRHPPQPTPFG